MADTGYFDSVSANLKTGVGAQVKGISEGVKANSDAGVSPSVNALDTGVKAAAAIGGLADGPSEAAMLPVLGAMGMKGMACLPISKQLDPVIGVDIHLVTIPPSPVVPMPHPYVGVLLRPQDFIAAAVSSFIPPASDSGTDGRRRQREARRGGPHRADDGRRDAGCHRQDRRLHPARGCIHTHAEHPAHPHGRRLGGPFSGDTQEQRPRLHGQPDGACRRDALLGRRRAPAPRLQRRGHTERAQGSGHVPAHGCHQPDTPRQGRYSPARFPSLSTPWRHSPASARGRSGVSTRKRPRSWRTSCTARSTRR